MGKSSDYNRDQRAQKLKKFQELKATLPSYVQPYLDGLMIDYQPNTMVAYTRDLITFFQYLQEMNPSYKDKELKDIPMSAIENMTSQDIIEYRNYLAFNDGINGHENQGSSIERRMAPLRGFFASAKDLGMIESNPTAYNFGRRRKKADKKEIVYLEKDEVRSLMHVVENSRVATEHQKAFAEKTQLRDTAILTLLLNTGIRVSECAGIDLDDLNFDNNSVRVVRKGGAEQTVYFGEKAAAALSDYIRVERPNYLPEDGEKALFLSIFKARMGVRAIENMVKKYSQNAVPNKHITPHKMRSTYGTALYDETADIRLVADVLGHEDVTTTARYYASLKEKHRQEAGQINLFSDDTGIPEGDT